MMPSDVSILSMLICYLFISVVRYLLRSLTIFLIRLSVFLLLSSKITLGVWIFVIQIYKTCLVKKAAIKYTFYDFLLVCGLTLNSLDSVFHGAGTLILMKFSLSLLYFLNCVFGVV